MHHVRKLKDLKGKSDLGEEHDRTAAQNAGGLLEMSCKDRPRPTDQTELISGEPDTLRGVRPVWEAAP